MYQFANIRQGDAHLATQGDQTFHRADRRIGRGGQTFVQGDLAGLRIMQDEIGEGPTDVETDAIAVRGVGHEPSPKTFGSHMQK